MPSRYLPMLGLLCALVVPACGADSGPAEAVALARAAHRRADAALDRGDLKGGVAALRPVLATDALAALTPQEQKALLQDTRFRLAELWRRQGHPKRSLDHARAGLALGDGGDLFAANLHIALARSLEALGEDRAAAASLERALQINEALLQAALGAEQLPEEP